MAVQQLRDGRWIVVYRDPDRPGKYKREYFGRGLDAEYQARRREKSLELRPWKRRTPADPSPTFFQLVQEYLNDKVGTIEKSTKDAFVLKMQGVILPELGETPAVKITARRLGQYVAKRLRDPVRKPIRYGPGRQFLKWKPVVDADGNPKTIKRTTVHRELSDILAVLNWAVDNKYLTYNPAGRFKKPKRDDDIISPPTAEETRRILAESPDHLIRAIVLSAATGIRPGRSELLSVQWNDVDLDERLVFVRSARKGAARSRAIPIHKKFVAVLQRWKKSDAADGLDRGPVIHWNGRSISHFRKSFNSAKRRAGITRRLRPYDFRHQFASAMLGRNIDLKTASELLGHSRPDTTARVYQHTNPQLHRDAIDRIPFPDLDPDE